MRLLTTLSASIALATAQYELQSTFKGETFFENFEFYNSWDPTFGFVHYVTREVAEQYGMINITNTTVSWGVDTMQTLNPNANLGRLSTRLYSIESWTHGLFIIDLAHMPANICGTWPAFWALGSGTWPENGEIDIIEYTNNVPNNLMAMHTSSGCTVAGADETGILVAADCGVDGGITGCTVVSTTSNNSGTAFNANGGGVYAMEWLSTGIRIWFFPRNAIPQSIISNTPDTSDFGTPSATFEGSCDIDSHFYNMSLIFDIDFCGEWSGNVFFEDGCPMLDPDNSWASCNEFVALSPGAFVESYWELNYLQIYQTSAGAAPSPTSSASSVTPAISTSSVGTALSNAVGRPTSFTMSLAGTIPSITTGSFTDTSSVPSVLSSLSSQSEALSTSEPASSVTTTPLTTAEISSTVASTVPTPRTPAITASPVTSSTQELSSTLVCESDVCTSITYAVVVQTVTVDLSATQATMAKHAHESRDLGAGIPVGFACNFTVPPTYPYKVHAADFACTSTREQIFNGTLWTETLTASTSIRASEMLRFFTYLEIDTIFIETKSTRSLTSPRQYTYTGSFVPTAAYIVSTVVSAYSSTTRFGKPLPAPHSEGSTYFRPQSTSPTAALTAEDDSPIGDRVASPVVASICPRAELSDLQDSPTSRSRGTSTPPSAKSAVEITKTLDFTAIPDGLHTPHLVSSTTDAADMSSTATTPLETSFVPTETTSSNPTTVFSTTYVAASETGSTLTKSTTSTGVVASRAPMRLSPARVGVLTVIAVLLSGLS